MKLQLILFSFSCIVFAKDILQDENPDAFAAVTAFRGLTSLYLRMKIREPHLNPDTTTDSETKKRICESITKSGHFDVLYKEDAVDVDEVLNELSAHVEEEKKSELSNIFFAKVLRDFENEKFTHRSRLIHFTTTGGTKKEEFAFACLTKDHDDDTLNIYYVSDQYDINTTLDIRTESKPIGARFVCLTIASHCHLAALAEESAGAFVACDYNTLSALEDVYRRMRKAHEVAKIESEDPLCGLTKSEKLRVCASVLSSSELIDEIKFYPDQETFEEECEFNQVSLELSEEETDTYAEWMLPCHAVEASDLEMWTKVYVSRAHESHLAFVYSQDNSTGKWNIDNMSSNISVLVEENSEACTSDATNKRVHSSKTKQ